jgi:hypothetical protein
MTTDHPVIKRAREIVAEKGNVEGKHITETRLSAVYQALAEITGVREPVRNVDSDSCFREFLKETLEKTGMSPILALEFGVEHLEK